MSCPQCFQGQEHGHGTPKGEMTTIHSMPCYATPPQSQSVPSKSTIIFITDAFGLKLINNKLLADEYAEATGMRVLMPDCIPNGGCDVSLMHTMDVALEPVPWTDIWGRIRKIQSFVVMLGTFIPFMIGNRPPLVYPKILEWIRTIKQDLPEGAKLGVAGFCWGGYHSTHLCKEVVSPSSSSPDAQSKPLINAQFTAHPSALAAPNDIVDAVKSGVPYSLALGTKDMVLATSKVDEAEAALKQDPKHAEYTYEFTTYKDMQHGFSVRGDASDKAVKEAMEGAKTQAIEWFKKYL